MGAPLLPSQVTSNLLVHNEWKYVRPHSTMVEAAWGGPHYPNASTATDPIDGHTMHCPARGCLFNVSRAGDSAVEEVSTGRLAFLTLSNAR